MKIRANPNAEEGGKLGITVEPLTPEIAQQLQLKPGTTGLVVDTVDPTGPALTAGIQRGDVIQEVNRQPVRDAARLARRDRKERKQAGAVID